MAKRGGFPGGMPGNMNNLMKQAQVTIPLKAVVTPSNRSWVFGDLLAHLQEEHAAFTAAKENHTV